MLVLYEFAFNWALSQGCPLSPENCAYAAQIGDLVLLQSLKLQGCPWDSKTSAEAAGEITSNFSNGLILINVL